MGWLIFGLLFCLLCTVGMTTQETSGDIMKGVMCVSICLLIGWVWWLKEQRVELGYGESHGS